MRLSGLALALIALAPLAARAGDKEAQDALTQAQQAWTAGKEPQEVLALFDQAEAHKPSSRVLQFFIKLNRAQFVQGKVGDLEQALGIYDQIIRGLINLPESEGQLRQIKSQAMANKANLVYAEKNDEEMAFQLYKSAAMLYPSARISETASQFMFRLSRNAGRRTDAQRKEILELGLKLAEEALKFAPNEFPDPARRAPWQAKFQLQLAIMQHAAGKPDEARQTFAQIQQDSLQPASLYQQAVWNALEGKPDEALRCLTEFMKTRPEGEAGLKARNQLRKFIRGEPDFKGLLQQPGWKELVEDEIDLSGH